MKSKGVGGVEVNLFYSFQPHEIVLNPGGWYAHSSIPEVSTLQSGDHFDKQGI